MVIINLSLSYTLPEKAVVVVLAPNMCSKIADFCITDSVTLLCFNFREKSNVKLVLKVSFLHSRNYCAIDSKCYLCYKVPLSAFITQKTFTVRQFSVS